MIWQQNKRDCSKNREGRRRRRLKYEDSVDHPLYHGSPLKGLKQIEPRSHFLKNSAHQQSIPPLVFLTDEIRVARLYTFERDLQKLVRCFLQRKKPKSTGSVYRVDTKNKRFTKISHPNHGWMYISTDPVRVKRELRPNQDESPMFTYGLSRLMLLISTGVLAYVFFSSWGLIAHG